MIIDIFKFIVLFYLGKNKRQLMNFFNDMIYYRNIPYNWYLYKFVFDRYVIFKSNNADFCRSIEISFDWEDETFFKTLFNHQYFEQIILEFVQKYPSTLETLWLYYKHEEISGNQLHNNEHLRNWKHLLGQLLYTFDGEHCYAMSSSGSENYYLQPENKKFFEITPQMIKTIVNYYFLTRNNISLDFGPIDISSTEKKIKFLKFLQKFNFNKDINREIEKNILQYL